MKHEIAMRRTNEISASAAAELPAIVLAAGDAARFAWDEFFEGELPNPHTRKAYRRAVRLFLTWCERQSIRELQHISPGLVGSYFSGHQGSIPTKKQHLAAIRQFFDRMVVRHAIILNPATSVRTDRYRVIEGKTPEISISQARKLLRSIDTASVVGLRDRAIMAVLIYTAARVGAVARLTIGDLDPKDGDQWTIRFQEKGGKQREIPVRYDLQGFLREYLDAAKLNPNGREPLFRTAVRRTKILTANPMTAVDMCRMVKRRMRNVGLPARLSPHSFRVTTITDLLKQGVPLEDVQFLAGHADPRTTRLYDRRQQSVTRNIVERISI